MNLTLVSRVVRNVSLVVVLWVAETSAPASVYTTGDVDPGGAAVQPDPWAIGGNLYVGKSAAGMMNVTDGGEVSNTSSYLGNSFSSIGEVTVTDTGSRWNHQAKLVVGNGGNGALIAIGKPALL